MHFNSWIEAKDFVEAKRKTRGRWAQEYYMEASEEFRKEMLKDEEVVTHGWLDAEGTDKNRNKRDGGGTTPTRGDARCRKGNIQQNPERGANRANSEGAPQNQGRCFSLNGEGHRAHQCPSYNPATKKDGNRCRRYGGMGHWATACPSLAWRGRISPG